MGTTLSRTIGNGLGLPTAVSEEIIIRAQVETDYEIAKAAYNIRLRKEIEAVCSVVQAAFAKEGIQLGLKRSLDSEETRFTHNNAVVAVVERIKTNTSPNMVTDRYRPIPVNKADDVDSIEIYHKIAFSGFASQVAEVEKRVLAPAQEISDLDFMVRMTAAYNAKINGIVLETHDRQAIQEGIIEAIGRSNASLRLQSSATAAKAG